MNSILDKMKKLDVIISEDTISQVEWALYSVRANPQFIRAYIKYLRLNNELLRSKELTSSHA